MDAMTYASFGAFRGRVGKKSNDPVVAEAELKRRKLRKGMYAFALSARELDTSLKRVENCRTKVGSCKKLAKRQSETFPR